MVFNKYKLRHFFLNKYILSRLKKKKYFMSYDYKRKALWYRTYKVGSRTINKKLKSNCEKGQYIYGSEMSYNPEMFKDYFKFAFVRNPRSRFLSAWKDKVLKQNYFKFSTEKHGRMKDLNSFLDWVETLDIDNCDEHLRSQNALIDLNNVDFIGRFEYFSRDLRIVMDNLEMQDREVVFLNKGMKKELELTREQELRIYNIYKKDFQIFYPNHYEKIKDIGSRAEVITAD